MDTSTPKFLQGVTSFSGLGLANFKAIDAGLYKVPADKRAQMIYFRAGNSTEQLVALAIFKNGSPIRYFPIGAKASVHVPLAVVEDFPPETSLEIHLAAPSGSEGEIVYDVGFVEI